MLRGLSGFLYRSARACPSLCCGAALVRGGQAPRYGPPRYGPRSTVGLLTDNGIPQYADAFNLDFDDIAGFQRAGSARCSGEDCVAGL